MNENVERIQVDYGRQGMWVDVPAEDLVKVLRMHPAEPLAEPEAAVREALKQPIGTPPLAELARGRKTACVVVSDITRPVPNPLLLPPILETLEASGIDREHITILVATGLHRPNEGAELVELVGDFVAGNYRVVNHVARDEDSHVFLGTTSGGTPAYVDRRFVEADLHVVTGLIEPHLMAGFSGGRKVVCPGLISVETIRVFHGPRLLAHEKAREGILEGNPVHREALEVARLARVDFAVDVALDEQRRLVGVFAGELEASHLAGVEFVREHVRDTVAEPADVVVTSSAGYPLDTTFYQAVKGVTAAAGVVREGGVILLTAECSEGLGSPDFTGLLRDYPEPFAFERALFEENLFRIDQWQYQELVKVLHKADVALVNDALPEELRQLVPVPVFQRFDEAYAWAKQRLGSQVRTVVIPRGPYVLAEVAA